MNTKVPSAEEPDGLETLIQHSLENDPGFADVWAPYAVVGRLVDERVRLGLSQAEVAERMGVPRLSIVRLENDPSKVSLGRIMAYAQTLGAELVVKPSKQKPKAPLRAGAKVRGKAA